MKHTFIRDGYYHFRVRIPQSLFPFFNTNLYVRSMRTKSKLVALKFSKLLYAKFSFIKQSVAMGLDYNDILNLVNQFTSTVLEDTEFDLYNSSNVIDSVFYLQLDDIISSYQKSFHSNDFSLVHNDILSIMSSVDSTEDIYPTVGKLLLSSHINNLKLIKSNIESDVYNKPKSVSPKPKFTIAKFKLGDTFNEFIHNTSIKDNWSTDTTKLNELVRDILVLFFGSDKDITSVSNKDLIDFRNILIKLPNKFKQMNKFKDKSLDYILSNSSDLPKLSDNTINKYIIRVNQFFSYCKSLDYISKDIKLDKLKESSSPKKRFEYNLSELSSLFNIVFNSSDLNLKWIVLLMMFQGMRLKEVTQLTSSDIKLINDVWCIDINDDDNKSVKTRNSIRTIPIHNRLLSFGFIDFVNTTSGSLFSIDNKQFSEFYRKKINNVVTSDDRKTLYSLRHNFINFLIQHNVRTEHIASIVGHSQEFSITMNTYGSSINVSLLKSVIDTLDYGF